MTEGAKKKAAPGWYVAPDGSGRERRWTGEKWTDEYREPAGPKVVSRSTAIATGILAVLLVAVLAVSLTLALSGDDGDGEPAANSALTSTGSNGEDENVDAPAETFPTLKPKDFTIKVKVREKKCYGSAGCRVTYQVEPNYNGPEDASVGSWDITYQVSGPEDGPAINTMELVDGTFSFEEEEGAMTPSTSTKLVGKVIRVEDANY